MRKNLLLLIVTVASLAWASCGKKSDDGGTGGGSGGGTNDGVPRVKVTKGSILADGFDVAKITVVDASNVDITAQATITVNGQVGAASEIYTTTPGTFSIKAQYNGKQSGTVTVTATDPGPSKYSRKVLSEDHTGTWCGYCPTESYNLNTLATSFPKTMFITVHNGASDPMTYQFEAQMRARFGVNAFPTTIVNKSFEWNGSSTQIVNETNKWAPLGIAIESSITGNTISGKVKAEFDVTTDMPLTVTIMLVENNIVHPQTNYYNTTPGNPFNGQGNPIPNYVHKYVLRKISTDLFGDAVPSVSQVKGTTYEKNFSFDATGYNLANCYVYATVGYSSSAPAGRSGVLNAQRVKAGQNQALD